MTSNDKLAVLERVFEARMIDLAGATDGAGRRVMITPRAVLGSTPTPQDFRAKIVELMGSAESRMVEYRGEEALACNIQLLAAAWEAALRYWDFQRELAK